MRIPSRPLIALFISLSFLPGCGGGGTSAGNPRVDDDSPTGSVASAVGGALSDTTSGGSHALAALAKSPRTTFATRALRAVDWLPSALAASICPTFRTTGGACSASGSALWLSYADCGFGGVLSWNGVQALTMSTGSASCGTFPAPGASGTLTRQYVTAAGSNTPSHLTLSLGSGSSLTIDDAAANLGNFDGATIATIANGGYGVQVGFGANGARSSLTLGHRTTHTSGAYDHSVTGQLTLSESPGAASRSISGSVRVYHNLLRVIGTSVFNGVSHSDGCCLPTGGSITTTFSEGANVRPSIGGWVAVGKSETLTFTGCGEATLQKADGSVQDVSLNRCY